MTTLIPNTNTSTEEECFSIGYKEFLYWILKNNETLVNELQDVRGLYFEKHNRFSTNEEALCKKKITMLQIYLALYFKKTEQSDVLIDTKYVLNLYSHIGKYTEILSSNSAQLAQDRR